MMKFLKNHISPVLAVGGGVLVMILRLFHLASANEAGLLASGHFAGILAGVLSLLIPAVLLWQSLVLSRDSTCRFPASVTAAIGYGIGAMGIACTSVGLFLDQSVKLMSITAFVGLVATVALVLMATLRLKGIRANVLYHGAVCLFFMLLLLCQYQLWSSEPQTGLYSHAIFAAVLLIVSNYHRACFDGKMGQLRTYTFFRTACIFFCLAAIPGSDFWFLYLAGAIWSATDFLNLTVLPKEGD